MGDRRLSVAARLRLVFAIVLLAVAAAGRANSQTVSPSDDAYHFTQWADGQHDENYIEWWYFNFADAKSGVHGIFTYLVSDPQNLSGIGFSQVTAAIYTPGGIVTRNDKYSVSAFSAANDAANVKIASNSVQALGSLYEIRGVSKDGRIAWYLQYQRQSDPWYAANHMPVGAFSWEQMNWLVYMPRAQVSGVIIVDGQIYFIRDQAGYHDHNWGEWIPFDALWNWAQYSQPGFSLELGDFIGKATGLLGVDVEGQHTTFTKDQYRLIHTGAALDPGSLLLYPTQSILVAQNDSMALLVSMTVQSTDALRGDLPFPLPDVLVFEQWAKYEGSVWRKDASGQWKFALSLQGGGFKEYTARQY